MAENKGVLREVRVKTKDEIGSKAWDSVYKLGTTSDYVRIGQTKQNLSSLLGYESEDEIIADIDSNRTLKNLFRSEKTLLDFNYNIWNATSNHTNGFKPADNSDPSWFTKRIPCIWKSGQFFYTGDFEYYATGCIGGKGSYLTLLTLNSDEESSLSKEKIFGDELSSMPQIDALFKYIENNKEVAENSKHLIKYLGYVGNFTADKDYGEVNSTKIIDVGPVREKLAELSEMTSWLSNYVIPFNFVIPKNTILYTRLEASSSARYAINLIPSNTIPFDKVEEGSSLDKQFKLYLEELNRSLPEDLNVLYTYNKENINIIRQAF